MVVNYAEDNLKVNQNMSTETVVLESTTEKKKDSAKLVSLDKHQFSDQIAMKIRQLNRLDNFHGPLQCVEDWLIIIACVAISQAVNQHRFSLVSIFVYLAAICVIGTRMRALAELLHQSAHGTLASNRTFNMVLGTVFTGWTVLQSWTGYRKTHVVEHHKYLGNEERDPDFQALIQAGLYDKNVKRSDVIQYLLSIPMPHTTLAYVKYLLINRINNVSESIFEKVLRSFCYLFIIFVLQYTGHLATFVLYWMIPMITTANWVGAFIEFFEHYPLLMKSSNINIFMSRNRVCSALEDFFLGIHNEGFHLVHHLWPRLPAWHLRKAHEIMMEDSVYKFLHETKPGWPAIIHDVLSKFGD